MREARTEGPTRAAAHNNDIAETQRRGKGASWRRENNTKEKKRGVKIPNGSKRLKCLKNK